jgi:hypothetical protein
MHVVYERCCGLDGHTKLVVACRLLADAQGQVQQEVWTFRTMTAEWLELADWLAVAGGTPVAMASTGGYWRPI